MGRIIKFRYRFTDGNSWIMTSYTLGQIINGKPYDDMADMPLLKKYKHVGEDQFTGLIDNHGNEVYEGDILIDDNYPEEGISHAVVEWAETEKYTGWLANPWGWDKEYFTDFEIIGNIHQNPELLKP